MEGYGTPCPSRPPSCRATGPVAVSGTTAGGADGAWSLRILLHRSAAPPALVMGKWQPGRLPYTQVVSGAARRWRLPQAPRQANGWVTAFSAFAFADGLVSW